jgi:hypothetical protein
MGTRAKGLAARSAAVAFLIATVAFAGATMKRARATIDLPKDTEPRTLVGLVYETKGWETRVGTIQLTEVPEAGSKQVTWLLTAQSGRTQMQRVHIDLYLLDPAEERLAGAKKSFLLRSGEPVDQRIDMKIPAGAWEKATRIRIEVEFGAV